ncbi:MAG TPA: nitrilase-related carbon-nitrogen hydrolase [Gammaproteobacteria bacterium]|nr:nitrilase-related carbon-nitrogen hydrolase [Gammaproteobacteria bacterium]
MASALDVKRLSLGVAATLASAVLIYFGTGPDPFWPCMWFALLPVLLFAVDATWWGAMLAGGFSVMLGILNLWSYLRDVLGVPLPFIAQIYLSEGIAYALALLLFRALMRRQAYWSALLAAPAVLVSFEWFLNLTSPHGTAGSLAYSQLTFLPYLQLASLTGPWGMSFLLLMFSSALAIGLKLYRKERRQVLQIAGVTGGLLVAVLVFGAVRLSLPAAGTPVKVGLVASDARDHGNVADDGAPTAELFQAYAQAAAKLAAQGAQVIVLPEKIGVTVEPDTGKLDAQLQGLAEQTHARIVAGIVRVVPPSSGNALKLRYNEARIYTPGAPVESYDKEHMLPPFESNLTPGTMLALLQGSRASDTWGVAICKDMDFTDVSRRYGEAGAGLLLVPAWDFVVDRIQHGHIAIMRGVEDGFSIVRSAKGGSLYVSDDRGRILGEAGSDSAPFATLLVDAPQSHDKTLFLLLGNWFAWVTVLLLALCLLQLYRRRNPRA